jgi:hypothetical protein
MATALASLSDVKSWLNIPGSNEDVLLTRLIGQASRVIYAYLTTNTLFLQSYTDAYDGVNNVRQYLNVWPVKAVSSVNVSGVNILPSVAQPQLSGYGYRLETFNCIPPGRPQAVDLYGYSFQKGRQNVYIAYTAGYAISDEAHTIPATSTYTITVNQPYGPWGQDDGVQSATGIVYTAVTGTPAVSQYSVNSTTGVYTFNAADAGTAMLISYSYIPADINQACIEWVAERYRYRDRISQRSKSLGGQETASYDIGAMSAYIKQILQPYKRTNI